jgi:high-affinity nickel-transport protein
MLIFLGALNLTGLMRRIKGCFTVPPDTPIVGADEKAANTSKPAKSDSPIALSKRSSTLRDVGLFQTLRPLFVGIVHGLAGSAAVALLVLTTIHNPWWALAYLLLFGFGTVAGMMLITSAIAMPIAYTGERLTGFSHTLATASGVLSVGFGCFIAYQIGVVNGLLTAHPHWTPR